MGGERGSTTRQRENGKICCFCHCPLEPPYPGRERACDRCDGSRAARHLNMRFEKNRAWRVSFQDPTDNQLNFCEFTFTDSAKVEELVARTATRMLLDDWHSFDDGLQKGFGTVTLTLTAGQYRRLLL